MPKFPSDWCISVKKPEMAKPWVKIGIGAVFVFFKICNHMNNGQTPWKKNEWFI